MTQNLHTTSETDPTSDEQAPRRYVCFGPIQVDLRHETVTRDGSPIRLSGKAYLALLTFLERPGEIVTRESLCCRLWPFERNIDKYANLNTTMTKLRRVIGDRSAKPLYIETIRQKGFVFIAHPELSDRADQRKHASNIVQENTSIVDPSLPRAARSDAKSVFPLIFYIVGLILVGALVGAAIWMAAWISYQGHGLR